jgi:hypothetical protein
VDWPAGMVLDEWSAIGKLRFAHDAARRKGAVRKVETDRLCPAGRIQAITIKKPGGGNRVEKSEGFPEGAAYHS